MMPRPSTGPLTDWLRAEAAKPFSPPMDDRQDQVALLWIVRELEQGGDPRLIDAAEALLAEGDPTVSTHLLEIAMVAPPAYRSAVARALANHPLAFDANSISQNRTLRGHAIKALAGGRFAEPLPAALKGVLLAATTPEEGWPTSALIGVTMDVAQFAPQLAAAVQSGDESNRRDIATTLVNTIEPIVAERVLAEVAAHAVLAARQQFLTSLEQALTARQEAGAFLAKRGLHQLPGPTMADLPRYRTLLGV